MPGRQAPRTAGAARNGLKANRERKDAVEGTTAADGRVDAAGADRRDAGDRVALTLLRIFDRQGRREAGPEGVGIGEGLGHDVRIGDAEPGVVIGVEVEEGLDATGRQPAPLHEGAVDEDARLEPVAAACPGRRSSGSRLRAAPKLEPMPRPAA